MLRSSEIRQSITTYRYEPDRLADRTTHVVMTSHVTSLVGGAGAVNVILLNWTWRHQSAQNNTWPPSRAFIAHAPIHAQLHTQRDRQRQRERESGQQCWVVRWRPHVHAAIYDVVAGFTNKTPQFSFCASRVRPYSYRILESATDHSLVTMKWQVNS